MSDIVPLPAMAASAAAHLASGSLAGHGSGFAAVESVARVGAPGARVSPRRVAATSREIDDEARATTPLSARGGDERRFGRVGYDVPYGRPSSPFLAQYLGQALAAADGSTGYGGAGQIAYRAAAERDITFFGIQSPIDLYI